jgi:cyclopropane fatty-acyl-phospholipid synthase-like methyltransferase
MNTSLRSSIRAAKRYDDSRVVKSFQRRTQALVLDDMWIEKGMNILDLGCGTGWATFEIASRLEGTGRVVGLDLSEKMLEQAERKLGEKAHVGSTTSRELRNLLISTRFSDVEVKTTKLNWFWRIMIGKGVKQGR